MSHWFQNRRRKDNHPEIEEKRVKKRSARMNKKSLPLDLTQHPMSSSYQGRQDLRQDLRQVLHRDSDDDSTGILFIADKIKSDVENDEEHVRY